MRNLEQTNTGLTTVIFPIDALAFYRKSIAWEYK
jgi:hypothetical protein